MPSTLDIVPLRSLVTVAACGGFHRAAAALHLTQAAVSRHVQRLEDTLDVALVEPAGRGIRFTAAGERLLVHARVVLDAHDDAVADFTRQIGALTVGTMDHAGDELLPELIAGLRQRFPDREIQFRLGRSRQLRDLVDSGRLDLALVLERVSPNPSEPNAIPTRWVAASDWTPSVRARLPLVLFEDPCGLRTGALQTLASRRIRHVVAATSPDLNGVHSAVRAGLGVTLLPAIGRTPDGTREFAGLPTPPGVVFGIRTGPHVDLADARELTATVHKLMTARLLDTTYSGGDSGHVR